MLEQQKVKTVEQYQSVNFSIRKVSSTLIDSLFLALKLPKNLKSVFEQYYLAFDRAIKKELKEVEDNSQGILKQILLEERRHILKEDWKNIFGPFFLEENYNRYACVIRNRVATKTSKLCRGPCSSFILGPGGGGKSVYGYRRF